MPDRITYTRQDLADSITTEEFAELARVSVRTAQRMVKDHEIDALHITGRTYRIPNRAVDAWLENMFQECGAA